MPAVHCPRCGARAEPGDRYCAACGATLPGAEPERKRSLRDRVVAAIGAKPRARVITAATALFLAIAVVAFIAVDTSDEEVITRDAYTLAADDVCVKAKRQIGRESRSALNEGFDAFSALLVRRVAAWRSEFNALQAPPGRGDEAAALDAALRAVEVKAAELSRVAREGSRAEVVAEAEELDGLTNEVESAISDLGLRRCARIGIAPGLEPAGR